MDETTNKQDEQLVLRTEGLVKVYGKRTVVNDVRMAATSIWARRK